MRPTLAIQIFRDLHYGADNRVAAISLMLLMAIAMLGAAALWVWPGRSGSESVPE